VGPWRLFGCLMALPMLAGCSAGVDQISNGGLPTSNVSVAPAASPSFVVEARAQVPAGRLPGDVSVSRDGSFAYDFFTVHDGSISRGVVGIQVNRHGLVDTVRTQPGWFLDSYSFQGAWLAWTETRGVQEDPFQGMAWTTRLMDLDTGKIWILARSTQDSPVPAGATFLGNRVLLSEYNGIATKTSTLTWIDLPGLTRHSFLSRAQLYGFVTNGTELLSTRLVDLGKNPGGELTAMAAVHADGTTTDIKRGRMLNLQAVTHDHILWQEGHRTFVANWPGLANVRQVSSDHTELAVLGDDFVAHLTVGGPQGLGARIESLDAEFSQDLPVPADQTIRSRISGAGDHLGYITETLADQPRYTVVVIRYS